MLRLRKSQNMLWYFLLEEKKYDNEVWMMESFKTLKARCLKHTSSVYPFGISFTNLHSFLKQIFIIPGINNPHLMERDLSWSYISEIFQERYAFWVVHPLTSRKDIDVILTRVHHPFIFTYTTDSYLNKCLVLEMIIEFFVVGVHSTDRRRRLYRP